MLMYIDVVKPRIELGGCLGENLNGLMVIAVDSVLLLHIKLYSCKEMMPLNDFFCY
jgi:hypothetical protein